MQGGEAVAFERQRPRPLQRVQVSTGRRDEEQADPSSRPVILFAEAPGSLI